MQLGTQQGYQCNQRRRRGRLGQNLQNAFKMHLRVQRTECAEEFGEGRERKMGIKAGHPPRRPKAFDLCNRVYEEAV